MWPVAESPESLWKFVGETRCCTLFWWMRSCGPCGLHSMHTCSWLVQFFFKIMEVLFLSKNTSGQCWGLNFPERRHSRNAKSQQRPRQLSYSLFSRRVHWIYHSENRYFQSFVLTLTNPLTIKGFVSSTYFLIPTLYPSLEFRNRLSTFYKKSTNPSIYIQCFACEIGIQISRNVVCSCGPWLMSGCRVQIWKL